MEDDSPITNLPLIHSKSAATASLVCKFYKIIIQIQINTKIYIHYIAQSYKAKLLDLQIKYETLIETAKLLELENEEYKIEVYIHINFTYLFNQT